MKLKLVLLAAVLAAVAGVIVWRNQQAPEVWHSEADTPS